MNIVIKANENLLNEIKQYYYADLDFSNDIPYTKFVISQSDLKVIAYTSNKVMFQGKNATKEAALWQEIESQVSANSNCNCILGGIESEHIGSDEVGTGDYFGPVVVCASYINQELANEISKYDIKDSKKLSDDQIRVLADKIRDIVPHVVYVLDNEKYNNAVATGNNANTIKAKMHNYVLSKLIKQINKKPLVIVDQFCSEKNYYNYLKDTKVVVDQIHFETKAEDKYLGVAVGAIIARDAFLEEMDKLSIKVGFTLQKGASNKVDMQGCDIIEKYGEDYLNKVAKIHFVNTQKIKEHMKQ